MKLTKILPDTRPSREEAEKAVKTLISWAGDDPTRPGLLKTPQRVVDSYGQLFRGYLEDPVELIKRSFENSDNYQDMVMLENIRFESYCEHHMLPIIGSATIAYIPNKRIIGIGRLASLVDVFARRLQIQENMTVQIAETIYKTLDARGVAVSIEALHHCMYSRGVNKVDSQMLTYHLLGEFTENTVFREKFFKGISNH